MDYADEKQLIGRLLKQAKFRCGVTDEIGLYPKFNFDGTAAAGRLNDRSIGIAYSVGLSNTFSPAEIEAILAHELGHIVAGDIDVKRSTLTAAEMRKRETAADLFAAKHGYGADSISAFKTAFPLMDDGARNERTHPSITARIRTIQRAINAMERTAAHA